jgi:ABC-2 type transport system ATP-binding protein
LRNARVLEIHGLRKSYGEVEALAGVDLTIARGEILALLGPNGAGKSTLISLIAGLTAPDRGTIAIDGRDLQADPMRVKAMLGVAPQDLGVYLQLTVAQNLDFFGHLVGLGRGALAARVGRIVEALDLAGLVDRRAEDLSGGEKRRLHTAMALLQDARLLLLDEPTAGVDIDTRARLLSFIRELADEGAAICYATHYLQEVETLGASVAILEHGQLVARGSLADLIAASAGAFVEIRLEWPLPAALAIDGRVAGDETLLRIATANPADAVTHALAQLGDDAGLVRGIEIVQPSLESAYLALTGKRFSTLAIEATA